MVVYPPAHEGHVYVLRKLTGQICLIAKKDLKPEFHTIVAPNVEVSVREITSSSGGGIGGSGEEKTISFELSAEQPPEEVKPVPPVFTKEQLGKLSYGEIRKLPEFAPLKSKSFRNKEDMIMALIALVTPPEAKTE